MTDDKPLVEIYCDGSVEPNPGRGGWGCVLIYAGHVKVAAGHVDYATNNVMEIRAVIEGLVFDFDSELYSGFGWRLRHKSQPASRWLPYPLHKSPEWPELEYPRVCSDHASRLSETFPGVYIWRFFLRALSFQDAYSVHCPARVSILSDYGFCARGRRHCRRAYQATDDAGYSIGDYRNGDKRIGRWELGRSSIATQGGVFDIAVQSTGTTRSREAYSLSTANMHQGQRIDRLCSRMRRYVQTGYTYVASKLTFRCLMPRTVDAVAGLLRSFLSHYNTKRQWNERAHELANEAQHAN